MRVALNTVSAQGVKSLGHDNDARIVMPFRVCVLLKKWSQHFLFIIFTEKINDNIPWSCLARQARPLFSPLQGMLITSPNKFWTIDGIRSTPFVLFSTATLTVCFHDASVLLACAPWQRLEDLIAHILGERISIGASLLKWTFSCLGRTWDCLTTPW